VTRALYRKYRSKSLSEIVGQTHVTDVLARSLAQGRVAHAYLLTGPRGVGKTSIARILAYEINKLPYDEAATHLDIIEIDAASNNGVEDVRDLREKVQIAPVSADKKVYIIDEVHMLSKAAFNALLKTLEEPPEHAVFILATTDVDKLPPTIISRTQRFSFRTISPEDAARHLRHIATEEKIEVTDDALELIAQRGDGSFRDSISLLDQLRSLSDDKQGITPALVEQSLGLAPLAQVEKLLKAYSNKDLKMIVELLDESDRSGIQPSILTSQLIQKIRMSIAEKPQLLPLLDQLLDVAKSSQPNVKLLTVLGSYTPKPKTAALTAAPLEISAPVAKLTKQAVKTHPATPVLNNKPELENALDFDWNTLIEYTRQNFVAVYSVLSKCSYELDSPNLTLYTANTFYKKKLDDTRHRINLLKALEEIGAGGIIITTIGTPPPPKDSTAAAVAAIMGGGEEVVVDA